MHLVALARNPVPSGAVVGTFKGFDGQPMRFARWEATRSPRRGTVCCFTGRTEYIEKYFEIIADLRRRGFAVAMMDWRGQGGSTRELTDPRKGYIRDFSTYDRDLACFMRDVVLPDCPPPYTALAHSMGGHIMIRNATSQGCWFERMVLCAPMIALHDEIVGVPQWSAELYARVTTFLGFGGRYVPGGHGKPIELGGYEGNPLTSDRERWARLAMLAEAAGELAVGAPTAAWLAAAYRSMRLISDPAYASRISVPLLIFVAGKDTIVESSAVEDFANRLKVGTQVLLAGSRHEILQESDDIRTRFWAVFDAYLGIDAVAA
jgi:lysophospholipase